MNQTETRIVAVSRMRVLAMVMIVAYHSLLFYTGSWWQFHGFAVPVWVKCARFLDSLDLSMFVFISGLLFGYMYVFRNKYRNKKIFIWGKVKRLIIPYLIWGCMMILFQPSLHSWDQLLTGISHLWFLLMLFGVFCMAIILSPLFRPDFSIKASLCVIVLLYVIWLLYHVYTNHHFLLCIESSLSYMLPFYIGIVIAEHRVLEKSSGKLIIISSVSIVILFIYVFYVPALNEIFDNLVIRILSYTSILGILIALSRIRIPLATENIIMKIDKLSMGIYIFNQIVINYILSVPEINHYLMTNYFIGPIVIFVVSFFVPLIISFVFNSNKYLSWMIGNA